MCVYLVLWTCVNTLLYSYMNKLSMSMSMSTCYKL
ncbi:unnamed protein product [Callosobruchus maculatus]|uniref:Uncharacterized protein n=1 Tax=Callosobruchus maculatus TaxID=64391 RepID=A0A653BS68_CALMS|nr:unnamed protein product [Callosobruchus maculatus]